MTKKRMGWLVLLGVLYLGMIGAGTCGKDAKTQIDKANGALQKAKQAQAPEFAANEYRSAEESLLLAQQSYDGRKYKKAQEQAATAEAQANLALDRALKEKARREEEARKQKEAEDAARTYNVSTLYSSTVVEASPGTGATTTEFTSEALNDIHFDYDSSGLSEAAKQITQLNAEWLKQHPDVKIEIEGHCDERGSEEYNLALGARRAKQVYDYLADLGIDSARMRTISYGESVPLDSGHDEAAWERNRRVHFAIVP